jgi:hypothetical protein
VRYCPLPPIAKQSRLRAQKFFIGGRVQPANARKLRGFFHHALQQASGGRIEEENSDIHPLISRYSSP